MFDIKNFMIAQASNDMVGFIAEKILRDIENPTQEQKVMAICYAAQLFALSLMKQKQYEEAWFDEETKELKLSYGQGNVDFINITQTDGKLTYDSLTVETVESGERNPLEEIFEMFQELSIKEESARQAKEILDSLKKTK